MAMPTRDAILAFVSTTGASEFVAAQKLEEFGGNLNEAINSYFSERDSAHQNSAAATWTNTMSLNQTNPLEPRGPASIFSALRTFRPSLLLDPNYRREFYNRIGSAAFPGYPTFASNQRPGLDVGVNYSFQRPHNLGRGQASEDMNRNFSPNVQENQSMDGQRGYFSTLSTDSHACDNDAEDQMIQAAIEASRQEYYLMNRQNSASDVARGIPSTLKHHNQEDDDIAQAISLSMETLEEEKALRVLPLEDEDQGLKLQESSSGGGSSSNRSEKAKRMHTSEQDSLPSEPPSDDESSVTVVVRMLDGTCNKRRFLKSDKLQLLFDFINISGAMIPGSYRIVVSYPRRAYSVSDSTLTLSEIGLTGKQEALFLEKI